MIAVLSVASPAAAYRQSIEGALSPCRGKTARYQYCPGNNHPYVWHWLADNGASVRTLPSTGDNCYHAEVTFGESSYVTITFRQSNPPGVPQVSNVQLTVSPRVCAQGDGQ